MNENVVHLTMPGSGRTWFDATLEPSDRWGWCARYGVREQMPSGRWCSSPYHEIMSWSPTYKGIQRKANRKLRRWAQRDLVKQAKIDVVKASQP